MLRVALTGGIASGKSIVAEVFRRRGYAFFSADRAGRDVMSPRGAAYAPIVERFGPAILAADRTIDRAALAKILFADPAARRFVESVVHPLVISALRAEVSRLEAEGRTDVFVSESALTFEAGMAGEFDRIVVVHCDPEIRIERLMARDGIGRDDALARIGAQMPDAEKIKRANYAIDASGALEETIARAEAVATMLLDEARAGRIRT
ncbi:MAG: dephospho-CoA kinase [Candidatus Aminicenantales bacterium]